MEQGGTISTAVCFAAWSAQVWGNGESGLGKEKIRKRWKCPVMRVAGSVPLKFIPEKLLCPVLTNLASRMLVASENFCPFTVTSDAFLLLKPCPWSLMTRF